MDKIQESLYKHFNTKDWIHVVPADSKPLFLNDPNTTYKDKETGKTEWFYVSWNDEEAIKPVPKLVPNNSYFATHLKSDTIKQVQISKPRKPKPEDNGGSNEE